MKIKDVKYNQNKIGYLFIFKSFQENIDNISQDLINNFQENKNTNLSEISLISLENEKMKLNNKQEMINLIKIIIFKIKIHFLKI